MPPPRFEPAGSNTLNNKHLAWKVADQRLLSLLLSSLTEEAMAEVVGLSIARDVWLTLENTFSHHLKARELRLKDDLQLMKRGSKPVADYARAFKALCDQLHAIGRFVDDTDKRSLEPSTTTAAAFTATNRGRTNNHGHPSLNRGNQWSRSSTHGSNSSNRGRSNSGQGRRPPRCQICRTEGHYADRCHQRYARNDSSAHLAEAFSTSCSLSGPEASDWYLDTGASAHMTTDPSTLDQCTNYTSKDSVIVGNGASLPITHTGRVVATGKRDGGLYVLERGTSAFISVLKNKSLHASYDLWHARLGHVPSLPHSASSLPSIETTTEIIVDSSSSESWCFGIFWTLPALLVSTEPKGFKSAAKNPAWLAAMDEEVQALQQNCTWVLVPRLANTNIVGSKWVFRTKYLPDGSIERLKARLVAKGYTQVPGLDYTDTFSPVIKATTVRVVLSLAVTNKWPLRQLDVKNAFLNGTLTEHVYMEQPPGYIDPRFPHHVCHLKKALYGLKQAPRAWFQRFSSFLLTLGFSCSRADTSLFVFHQQFGIIYLLLYVDDIIITGNNSSLLDSFTRKLHSEFATKDLGSLSYFLGLEASPTPDGLFLSQLKYARDILTRAQLLDSKPVYTPMVVSQHLSADGPHFPDPTLYRFLVGALQYLTITRPDIAHVVNSVSQFLHAPTADHFLAVKRILRYVKGTLHFGLTFRPFAAPGTLVAYSDADWAGCPDTRRSTSGYSIYLAELLWLTHLLHDLKVPLPQQPLLLCDNKSAIFLSSNPVSHKRAKHVELDYHFLRELVVAGKLRTQYVPSHLQVADIFTKSVSRSLFEFFRSKLHVHSNPTLSLRGGVEDT
uniref:Uncharacterized protein n=1 Tax=Fagus sylvatica TaxID=28930 RepID=A0A2N9HRT6_FAGSY